MNNSNINYSQKVVEMKNITKKFGSFVANDNINLTVHKGEVHALLGENGAGKSTLMNILYGLYQQTSGEIYINEKLVNMDNPNVAIANGIGMVHQHFMLVQPFTVAQNIILGVEPTKGLGSIDINKAIEDVKAISEKYGLYVDPNAKIEDISVGMQQRVEILKALYRGAEILILDEPTNHLDSSSIEWLEDYLNASWIIDNISTKEEIKKYCKEEILKIDAKGNMSKTGNETIFIMVSVLYAIKYEEECFDIVDNVKDCWEKNQLIRLYFESFTWRSSYTSNDHFLELASKYQVNPKVIWDVYIENATKVHSEINAIGLSDFLKEMEEDQEE